MNAVNKFILEGGVLVSRFAKEEPLQITRQVLLMADVFDFDGRVESVGSSNDEDLGIQTVKQLDTVVTAKGAGYTNHLKYS